MWARALAPLSLLLPLTAAACASSERAAPVDPAPAAKAAPPAAPAPKVLDHTVARSAVRAVVSAGLGMFLRRIDLDDQPVFVDLKPGDVVTSVNGLPIERPDQAETAFESLEVASELRVALEREGQPRELVYPIVDDR